MDEQDLRLIRLVTRQFTDLQGLGLVLAASAQIAFGVVWLSTHDIAVAVAAVVAGVAASVPLGRRVQRYYADRFGRVDSGRGRRWIGVAGFVIVSVAEIPCGFADHALLQRAMTMRAEALPDTEHADAI